MGSRNNNMLFLKFSGTVFAILLVGALPGRPCLHFVMGMGLVVYARFRRGHTLSPRIRCSQLRGARARGPPLFIASFAAHECTAPHWSRLAARAEGAAADSCWRTT